jgi:hypothetical protein
MFVEDYKTLSVISGNHAGCRGHHAAQALAVADQRIAPREIELIAELYFGG